MNPVILLLGLLALSDSDAAQANADAALVRAHAWDKAHCEYFGGNDCDDTGADISCKPSLKKLVDCTWTAGHSPVGLACGGIYSDADCVFR